MDEQRLDEIAAFRWSIIAPVLAPDVTPAQRQRQLRQIARQSHEIPYSTKKQIGLRTLHRWVAQYLQHGFRGLKPQTRSDANKGRVMTPEILQAAIALRREAPERSVERIIELLELTGQVPKGLLKRTTLSEHLIRAGYGRRAVLTKKTAYRRFSASRRNELWQGDVQHTLSLPHPTQPGRKRQAYLIAVIDDFSRQVFARFYLEEKLPRLEDCLKRAILLHGIPEQLYVDNGAIYSTHHLKRICAKLGIRLSHSRPGRPQGRGKIERWFRTVDQSFLPEALALLATGKLRTLAELNELLWAWMEMGYHNRIHGVTRQTPRERFDSDPTPLRRIDPVQLREVFLWEEYRTVDKTGCISLYGNQYEVATNLSRCKVRLRFDPYDLGQIQVFYDGKRFADAVPVKLRRHRHQGVEPSPEPAPPKSGLNYLTLTRKAVVARRHKELGTTAFTRLSRQGGGESS